MTWRARPRLATAVFPLMLAGLLSACGSPTAPEGAVDFLVDVAGERFVLRLTNPVAIVQAEANLRGLNSRFPLGAVRRGDGGFNQPWSWHLDPQDTELVELAIEVCDGRPSYLQGHLDEYPVYCPWGARVVRRLGG